MQSDVLSALLYQALCPLQLWLCNNLTDSNLAGRSDLTFPIGQVTGSLGMLFLALSKPCPSFLHLG